MRPELEMWAWTVVVAGDWKERNMWFNVRLRDLERQEQAMKRQVPCVLEQLPPYTVDDAVQTILHMRANLLGIAHRLQALEEMRGKLGALPGPPQAPRAGH